MEKLPELAGTTRNPLFAVTITSFSSQRPSITCSRLNSARKPRSTSTLASPRSASSNMTRRRARLNAVPRLIATLDFPTPPLPPVIAMTLTGGVELILRNPCCLIHAEINHWPLAPWSRTRAPVRLRRDRVLMIAHELRCALHEPGSLGAREIEIFGYALPVREVRNGQSRF